jgi:hypothetical protein
VENGLNKAKLNAENDTRKERFERYYENWAPAQRERFFDIFDAFITGRKMDVIKCTSLKQYDFGRPQSFNDILAHTKINPWPFVWNYDKNTFGEPVNVVDAMFSEGHKMLTDWPCNYE